MASLPLISEITPLSQTVLAVQELVDKTVLPTSSLIMKVEAEASPTAPRPELVSGITVPSQPHNIKANVEPPNDCTSQQSTMGQPQRTSATILGNDVEIVLNNAGLLSLYYDPMTDQFHHAMRCQLNKDDDFDTVQSLLNNPGFVKMDESLTPRLDLFFVDCSLKADHGRKRPGARSGWEWVVPDAANVQARRMAIRVLHDAFHIPQNANFGHFLRAEKRSSLTMEHVLEGSMHSSHLIAASECIIVWSYNAASRQTVGIVMYQYQSTSLWILDILVAYLIGHCSLTTCSMLIAVAVQDAFADLLEHRLRNGSNKVHLTEQRTGYHSFYLSVPSAHDEAFDPAAETAKASGLAGSLVIDQNHYEGLQALARLGLQETEESIQSLKDTDPPKWKSDLTYVKELLVISSWKFAARRVEAASLQARASIQIQGLFNIIAQHEQELTRKLARDNIQLTQATLQLGEATRQIAEDSKRDSTSMKAIAAVTMFFLPGTFAASLFAMPIFHWSASSGNDVVNPRIWVYWAVTIPLTLVTFGCFLLWDHLMNKPRYPRMTSSQEAAASNQSLAGSKASADNSSTDSVHGQTPGAVSRHSSAVISKAHL